MVAKDCHCFLALISCKGHVSAGCSKWRFVDRIVIGSVVGFSSADSVGRGLSYRLYMVLIPFGVSVYWHFTAL